MASWISSVMDSLLETGASVLRVPSRSSNGAKLEHLLCLAIAALAVRKVVHMGPRGVYDALLENVISVASSVPGLAGVVEKEKAETMAKIKDFVLGDITDPDTHRVLPAKGVAKDELLDKLSQLRLKSTKFQAGKGHGGVYHLEGESLEEVQVAAFRAFNCSNALYPGLFPAVRKFEAEAVRMVVSMLNGDDKACGTLTSGGTESVLMAVLAYREAALARGITRPELVACTTAHAACDKACHYFGVKLVHVPFGDDYRMSVEKTRKAINSNTIAIYCSAPTFPHGVVDDVEALSKLALSKGVGLHVDNCLGGFLLSSVTRQKLANVSFDFKVPGVTSISVDIHKYGFAAKGASCICYRDTALRQRQYTTVASWSGGLYCTPTFQGSRSGALMAAAWSTMLFMGQDGYDRVARNLHDIHTRVRKAVESIPGLKVLGNPITAVVSFTSDDFNIYVLADAMSDRGWEVPRLQKPACVHYCISEHSYRTIDAYLADLRDVAATCYANKGDHSKDTEGMAGIYGMAGTMPGMVVKDLLKGYLDVLYTVE